MLIFLGPALFPNFVLHYRHQVEKVSTQMLSLSECACWVMSSLDLVICDIETFPTYVRQTGFKKSQLIDLTPLWRHSKRKHALFCTSRTIHSVMVANLPGAKGKDLEFFEKIANSVSITIIFLVFKGILDVHYSTWSGARYQLCYQYLMFFRLIQFLADTHYQPSYSTFS